MYHANVITGTRLAKEAVALDRAGRLREALDRYTRALSAFTEFLHTDPPAQVRAGIEPSLAAYFARAEAIKARLDSSGGGGGSGSGSGGGGGGGGGGESSPDGAGDRRSKRSKARVPDPASLDPDRIDGISSESTLILEEARDGAVTAVGLDKAGKQAEALVEYTAVFDKAILWRSGVTAVELAFELDDAGDSKRAFAQFRRALEYFESFMKLEDDDAIRKAVQPHVLRYVERAEALHKVLGGDDGAGGGGKSGGSDTADTPMATPTAYNPTVRLGKLLEDLRAPAPALVGLSNDQVWATAMRSVHEAVAADSVGAAPAALDRYCTALQLFVAFLAVNPAQKEVLCAQIEQYFVRAETIKDMLMPKGPAAEVAPAEIAASMPAPPSFAPESADLAGVGAMALPAPPSMLPAEDDARAAAAV